MGALLIFVLAFVVIGGMLKLMAWNYERQQVPSGHVTVKDLRPPVVHHGPSLADRLFYVGRACGELRRAFSDGVLSIEEERETFSSEVLSVEQEPEPAGTERDITELTAAQQKFITTYVVERRVIPAAEFARTLRGNYQNNLQRVNAYAEKIEQLRVHHPKATTV
jgi:hypothetical protein